MCKKTIKKNFIKNKNFETHKQKHHTLLYNVCVSSNHTYISARYFAFTCLSFVVFLWLLKFTSFFSQDVIYVYAFGINKMNLICKTEFTFSINVNWAVIFFVGFFLMPFLGGFLGNLFIPKLLKVNEWTFPRLNYLGCGLEVFSFLLISEYLFLKAKVPYALLIHEILAKNFTLFKNANELALFSFYVLIITTFLKLIVGFCTIVTVSEKKKALFYCK